MCIRESRERCHTSAKLVLIRSILWQLDVKRPEVDDIKTVLQVPVLAAAVTTLLLTNTRQFKLVL